ncbi:MAG TPA: HNH endonuclease signature motif containing protein [Ktedonobacteraceae bacterium]|nr:HNH endonuclease signature motif containing protein [Ktedonobacteraceae bacterium]
MPYKNKAKKLEWMAAHPEKTRRWKREWVRKLRQSAIEALGGACVLCGYTDIRALEIDHITPIRNSKNRIDNPSLFMSIVRGNTENLQVLCANCHAIKTYEENAKQGESTAV